MQLIPRTPPQRRCLIVEDSAFDCEKLKRIVSRLPAPLGIEVATTLRAARRALENNAMALILLDNNLPDGFGANFALELADHPLLGDIPIIMVSDWPSPFMWQKAESAGVAYVLSKSEIGIRHLKAALEGRKGRLLN